MDIDKILREAPSKIAFYSEKQNLEYGNMIKLHEGYKRLRAKKYLEMKAQNKEIAIKDIEYSLDIDIQLIKIKDEELLAEINYRGWKTKKEKANDFFESSKEQGYNRRQELRGLQDTISKERSQI